MLTRVGNIPDVDLISFEKYAIRAFQNMKLQTPDPSKFAQLYNDKRHLEKALAFMVDASTLGPVVEAVILVDRYHYAKESSFPMPRLPCKPSLIQTIVPETCL